MTKSKQLNEINLLRPIVIVLLVLLHSFTMYGGGWPLPEGIENVRGYFWIAKGSYACLLETFTFISGYLFAYSILKGKKYTFKELFVKKMYRLIIPSIIFSIFYSFLFYDKSFVSFRYVYDIINGLGHMWYLPMLFWCFLFTWFLLKLKINEKLKLLLLVGLSICSFIPLPLQMTSTLYYLFFFYLGIYFMNHRSEIYGRIDVKRIIWMGGVFVVSFVILTLFRGELGGINAGSFVGKVVRVCLMNLSRLIYASLGLYVFYMMCVVITRKYELPKGIVNFNKISFGVYLFQQFILKILYYKTTLPSILGTYWLPWFGFIITLILSVILSSLLLKTKVGRYLIG